MGEDCAKRGIVQLTLTAQCPFQQRSYYFPLQVHLDVVSDDNVVVKVRSRRIFVVAYRNTGNLCK